MSKNEMDVDGICIYAEIWVCVLFWTEWPSSHLRFKLGFLCVKNRHFDEYFKTDFIQIGVKLDFWQIFEVGIILQQIENSAA